MAKPPIKMRVLDGELGEKLPDMTPFDFAVPENFTIDDVAGAIYDRAIGKQISRLTLICHGVGLMVYGDRATRRTRKTVVRSTGIPEETFENVERQPVALPGLTKSDPGLYPGLSVCRIYGGYGLFLGKDTLSLDNASVFSQFNGWFSDDGFLEICGCAAADTGPTDGELSGDGPKLMRALAAATGAAVRAPIRLQQVNQYWMVKMADRSGFTRRSARQSGFSR